MPPAYKGHQGKDDVGYGVYDMYDLGEFDQKGSVPTKYGTKDEYLAAIKALHANGIRVIGDLVMNHRMAADNRNWVLKENHKNEVWTQFIFPGRNGRYSHFCWNASHFDGVDYDANTNKNGIFRFDDKQWDDQVNVDHGNYDYLTRPYPPGYGRAYLFAGTGCVPIHHAISCCGDAASGTAV